MSILFVLAAGTIAIVLLVSAIYTAEEVSWDIKAKPWKQQFSLPEEGYCPIDGMTLGEKIAWLAEQIKNRKQGEQETQEETTCRIRREHKQMILDRVAARKANLSYEQKLCREAHVESMAWLAKEEAKERSVFEGLEFPRPTDMALSLRLCIAADVDKLRAAYRYCNDYCIW